MDDNPLTTHNYQEIGRALALLNKHKVKCDIAKSAGYDVTNDLAMNDYYRELFEQHKKVFFPNKP
jgi:hypothetical protein